MPEAATSVPKATIPIEVIDDIFELDCEKVFKRDGWVDAFENGTPRQKKIQLQKKDQRECGKQIVLRQ